MLLLLLMSWVIINKYEMQCMVHECMHVYMQQLNNNNNIPYINGNGNKGNTNPFFLLCKFNSL